MSIMIWVFALGLAGAVLDAATTLYATERWGVDVETNPLWRWGLRRLGAALTVLIYFVVVMLWLGFGVYLDLAWFAVAALWAYVLNNVVWIIRNARA